MPDTFTPDNEAAWQALRGHPWWPYRACAPDQHNPAVARGDHATPVDVWLTPDQETQTERPVREHRAVTLCGRCPIQQQCLTYALGDENGPYERYNIWGGQTPAQRAQTLARRRREAAATPHPDTRGLTPLDLTVLAALATHRTPQAVAQAAGLTVARANWHRSKAVTALALDPATTTRTQLLYAARTAGILDPATPIRPDHGITAAIPSRQPQVTRAHTPAPAGTQLALPGLHLVTTPATIEERPVRRTTRRRTLAAAA